MVLRMNVINGGIGIDWRMGRVALSLERGPLGR